MSDNSTPHTPEEEPQVGEASTGPAAGHPPAAPQPEAPLPPAPPPAPPAPALPPAPPPAALPPAPPLPPPPPWAPGPNGWYPAGAGTPAWQPGPAWHQGGPPAWHPAGPPAWHPAGPGTAPAAAPQDPAATWPGWSTPAAPSPDPTAPWPAVGSPQDPAGTAAWAPPGAPSSDPTAPWAAAPSPQDPAATPTWAPQDPAAWSPPGAPPSDPNAPRPSPGPSWPPPAGGWPPAGTGSWPPPGAGWPPPRRRPVSGGLVIAVVAVLVAALVGLGIGSRWGTRRLNLSTSSDQGFVPTPSADGSGSSVTSQQAAAVAAAVDPGVVDIYTNLAYQNAAAAGTGMVLTSSGEVLTNNHVIDGATSIRVQPVTGGKSYTAQVVGEDPAEDVAVLQLENASGLRTIKTGDSSKVAVGQAVIAIGNAGGVGGAPSVVTGTVQALNQSITASDQGGGNAEQLTGLIETNAPLQPGDSGGPLVSTSGEVIGMDTAASANNRFESAANVGFAIPINKALSVARQIESGKGGGGIVIGLPGFLGVEVQDAGSSQGGFGTGGATAGAAVAGVVPGSPAESAGIRQGDVITGVDGETIAGADALTTTMRGHHPGDRVQLHWTDTSGDSHTATVTLTKGPAA